MDTLPTVTFLFTDIEGSTRLWESEPARMDDALGRHDQLCRTTVEAHGGQLVKMIGDGMYAAFEDPAAAIASVLELQRKMAAIASTCGIPLKMRCGLHAGVSRARDGDFFGTAVNRAARIAGTAHGGQVLLSQAVVDLAKGRFPDGTDLLHLGRVRLRDLSAPEDVWQLLHTDLERTFPALRSLDSTPNNLPQQLSSFVGRENEIDEITKLLGSARLLTITGSGGCGKTRLSLQVAAALLESCPDGVWLVELASLTDADLVPQAVATVLGLREAPGQSLTQTLIAHLKPMRLLLVLDNAEHLLAACAQLANAVLRQCSQIALLVSSREALRIEGELTYRVPSLSVPDPKQDDTPERLSQYESVRLFVERALFHQPRFVVTDENATALASVCHRLDGIPLALELAAARVRSMSVGEVNRRLDQRFRLLTGGARSALPRQQTLRSMIDWSYDLLQDSEKALLCRVSVFSGGWTVEAAKQVCLAEDLDDWDTLDRLSALVDKNLVVAEERNGETRYRLLETVRQYARDRLQEGDVEIQWRDRHLAYFLAAAEEANPQLREANQQVWLDRLETEHDNMRSALAWSLSTDGDAMRGLSLAGELWWFWLVRGYLSEGRGWLSKLLAAVPHEQDAAVRARALNGAGYLALLQGDYAAARAAFEENLAIYRELGDKRGIFGSLNNLGNVDNDQGNYASAKARWQESLAICREVGDERAIVGVLSNLGNLACVQGDYATARTLLDEGLAYFRKLGVRRGIAAWQSGLAAVDYAQGDYPSARARWQESLAIFHGLGDRQNIADTLEGLAGTAMAISRLDQAVRLWGAAERLREEIGAPLPHANRIRYERQVAAARTAYNDDAAFHLAWQTGRSMTLEQIIGCALE